jgi:serine O-acetyltransferase
MSPAVRRVLQEILPSAVTQAAEDAASFADRDPEKQGDPFRVVQGDRPYEAMMLHRVNHELYKAAIESPIAHELFDLTRRIFNQVTVATGVEIHPAASFGPRAVLDHGFGSQFGLLRVGADFYGLDHVSMGLIVGETASLGCSVVLADRVVLGSPGIASNPRTWRHPLLGDGVELASGAKIFGPVILGDRVRVGSEAFIFSSVGQNSRIGGLTVVRAPVGKGARVGIGCVVLAPVPDGARIPDNTRFVGTN